MGALSLSVGLTLALALALALALTRAANGQGFSVNPDTGFIRDSAGRSRIFHGVNAVYKVWPWHPNPSTYSTVDSMTSEDCAALAGWGFTSVRLGMMWPGVSLAPGVFNATYLDVMEEIVNCLGSNGIGVLLDAHQDIFSRFYCGEGVPDFLVAAANWSAVPFPEPITTPLPIDPGTGYPNLTACLERGFADYYFSDAVASAFQALYDNTDGLQSEFAAFWHQVASRFAGNEWVLGYELINEPFAGNVYADPKLLLEPGYADRTNLAPMYEALASVIRAADPTHLVFFEPAVSDVAPTGLTQVPGGPAHANTSVFSFHVYCGPTNASGDPTNVPACNGVDSYLFDMHISDAKRLGGGAFMTEFGAMEESPNETAALEYLLSLADQFLVSTSYWQYKSYADLTTASEPSDESFFTPDGSLQETKVKTLARTYAYAIAGVPTAMSFDPATSVFSLTYICDPTVSSPTEIYFNGPWYYPNGVNVAVSPPNAATFTIVDSARVLVSAKPGLAPSTEITVTLTALGA